MTAQALATPTADTTEAPSQTHTVVDGDTLWGVSEEYYDDPYAWPKLWSLNPQVTNPHYIYPGDELSLGGGSQLSARGQRRVAVQKGKSGPSRRLVSLQPSGAVSLNEQAYLDPEALEQAGVIMGSNSEHMMLSVSDEAYVQFEQEPRAPVGRELLVFRRYNEAERAHQAAGPTDYDPEEEPGEMVRVLGTLQVLSYDRETKVARVEVTEAVDVIERGFRVADQPRTFTVVAPVTNARSLETDVIAAVSPVQLVGQNQLVFLAAGSGEGLKAGNRLFVYRHGDEWRKALPSPDERAMGADRPAKEVPDESLYPDDILAEVLVLYTRPETSTAIVTHAVREVLPGDTLRMVDGY